MGFRLQQKSLAPNDFERQFTQCYAYCDETAEDRITRFLPERDYVTFGYAVANSSLVVVCSVRATYSAVFETRCSSTNFPPFLKIPNSDLF